MYWMSRYFERADHCARVLEVHHNLMLNPSKVSTEQRWMRIAACLGFEPDPSIGDPQVAMARLTGDTESRASLISCLTSARENASQVREQISAEMWERLNQLYHETTQSGIQVRTDGNPLRLVTNLREGSYRFYGVTEQTMNHDEGWHFIQFGKFMERACAISILLDAHYSAGIPDDDLEWVGLLTSCSAFEAYCKVYMADFSPNRIAEFLLLNPEFPHTVRYSVEYMMSALESIAEASAVKKPVRVERLIGQLQSSLAYSPIREIMTEGLHEFLNGVLDKCRQLHAAVHEFYIDYPIESAFEA